jgi:hypothetical protein
VKRKLNTLSGRCGEDRTRNPFHREVLTDLDDNEIDPDYFTRETYWTQGGAAG